MNSWLGRVDLSDDIKAALRQIAVYLEEHDVDVMLVAGEPVFRAVARCRECTTPSLRFARFLGLLSRAAARFWRSRGNHDAELKFETLREALALGQGNGRFVITANPLLTVLTGPKGERVQFVLMPFPTSRALPGWRGDLPDFGREEPSGADQFRRGAARFEGAG